MISSLLFYSNERNKPYLFYIYYAIALFIVRSTSALFVARNRQYLRNK